MSATTLALVAALALAAAPAAAGLAPAERKMVAAVDAATPRGLELLQRAVDVNSGTMNFAGVREVARLFQPELERLGFTARWVDGAAWGRAGHLIAERPGRGGGPRVLLIGHLDTVFEADSPFQRWEKLSDTEARGPGAIDMKGGVVVLLLALEGLARAGALDRLALTVVLTGDEEKPGAPIELARADLIAAADRADLAIGFEDGAGDPRTAVIARRGSASWVLKTSGRPAHSSQIFKPEVGDGAIYEQARILNAFRDSLRAEPWLTFSPGVTVGGTKVSFDREQSRGTAFGKTNVVAESTYLAGDLRAVSPEQRERAVATMQRIVARNLPGTGAAIEFGESYPPLAPSDGNRRLLALFDRASRDLDFGPVEGVDPSRAGAADVSFAAGRVEGAIDGLGLMGRGGHTVGETADLTTLPMQAKRVAVLLSRLVKEWGSRPGS